MTQKERKGTFGDLRLAVAKHYLFPVSRNPLILLAVVLAGLLLAWGLVDLVFRSGRLLSSGPLSSSHANLGDDCAACHATRRGVTDDKCSVCHEKFGDRLGVYTFATHYLYRSGDFQRIVPSPHEVPCAGCHQEHGGREPAITPLSDKLCLRCHEYGSFNRNHPQFAPTEARLEDARLRFPHIHHVREVMRHQELADVERACLYCHNPQSDGRGFENLDFERHCDACHLTTTTATPMLPIGGDGGVGVATLEQLQQEGGLGTRWAFYTNPNEFRATGSEVRKSPVYHRDPWIQQNLRRLRQRLFPDAGLVDLLRSSSQAQPHEQRQLYQEALVTLREWAEELRSFPERDVQRQLRQVDTLLRSVERKVADPYTPLDETRFLLSLPDRQSTSEEERLAIESLVSELTTPCQQCHVVSDATIVRVQKDQKAMRRAHFDHRAHILQRRCLDCHTTIPFLEHLNSSDPVEVSVDRAEIQNLPTIETCRECHAPHQAANRCVTCHYFHPNKTQRSNLLLYLDRGGS